MRGRSRVDGHCDPEKEASDQIAHILDRPPVLMEQLLRGSARLTNRWGHGALHDHLPGMSSHVIMTYYGSDHDIVWRNGAGRIASRTRRGTITLIPQGEEGRWDIAGPIEVSHVYLPDSRLQACATELTGRPVELLGRVGFDDPAASRNMEVLSHEAHAPDPASLLFVEQALDLLCLQLVRGHSSYNALVSAIPKGGLAHWQVRRVTDYMQSRLDEEISLDELAGVVSLSRFHFCSAFRKATGYTPHHWLMKQRIDHAIQLLRRPDLPVTEIALAVGYQTPSAFTAAFRKLMGTSPTEYRRQR